MPAKKQTLYNVIKVAPKRVTPDEVPESFLRDLIRKKWLQNRSFSIIVYPLSMKDYKLHYLRRYSNNSIIKFFNENLVPIGASVNYILRFPLLVKGIIDSLFELSGRDIEELNMSPDKMFQLLKERRRELGNHDALMDHFVMANMGIEPYLQFYRKIESLEDRLSFVAVLENYFGVIIEERYLLSQKIKKPIKLTPDKQFSKEYERAMNQQSGQDFGFGDITKALAQKLIEDRRMAEYGITSPVKTSDENREFAAVDSSIPDKGGGFASTGGLRTNLD